MSSRKLMQITLEALNDAKALNIVVCDIRKQASISDYMVIASGRSKKQVSSITDKVIEATKENQFRPIGVEGKDVGEWALVDLGDVIVHIMHPESREYYQLEKLWNGSLDVDDPAQPDSCKST